MFFRKPIFSKPRFTESGLSIGQEATGLNHIPSNCGIYSLMCFLLSMALILCSFGCIVPPDKLLQKPPLVTTETSLSPRAAIETVCAAWRKYWHSMPVMNQEGDVFYASLANPNQNKIVAIAKAAPSGRGAVVTLHLRINRPASDRVTAPVRDLPPLRK